jgi:hypothetical protein
LSAIDLGDAALSGSRAGQIFTINGQNFFDLAKQEMLEKLVVCGIGSRFTLTA